MKYTAVSLKLIPSMRDCKSSGNGMPNLPRYSISIARHIHMESTSEPSRSKMTAFIFCNISCLMKNFYLLFA